jgi:hypothetical protein
MFGESTQMQMSYTIDGTIENYSETATAAFITKEDGKEYGTIIWKENGKRASYLCFTASDLNYLSIHTFSEFATAILCGKCARLTNHLYYDGTLNAIILFADNGRIQRTDSLPRMIERHIDLIQCKYYLNNGLEEFISQLNHINTQIELAGQILDGQTA